jgi:hypothetical protein
MKAYGGVEAWLHHSLLRLDLYAVSFTSRLLYPEGEIPGTHIMNYLSLVNSGLLPEYEMVDIFKR